MDENCSNSTLDKKMAEMRIKNTELLKRHKEIEEDRQFAVRLGATTVNETMRGSNRNRPRITTNQANVQETQYERPHRVPTRRKFDNDRNDNQPQRAQRVDYNRLKHDRAQEMNKNSMNPELQDYAYPFHYQSETNHDADEPAHAKKLVIVNNKAGRVGSGRFNQQQQRTQEQGQRKREERIRRVAPTQNHGRTNGNNEFHLDVPPMPVWQNSSSHVQYIPTNLNTHSNGFNQLINTNTDQMDQSAYTHKFVYPSAIQPSASFNSNGTVYFAHPSSSSSSQSTQTHFHQYHSTRSQFQSSHPIINELSSKDLPTRFRHHDNKFPPQQRPMSGDFERLHNPSTRFQFRPQSFYDFSSNNNNTSRSSNNNRYQRNNNNTNNTNNNPSLPLSAYMNIDDSFDSNENLVNHRGTTHQKRRTTQQRTYNEDKHQFPLSSYDPRQYGFSNKTPRRNDFNQRSYTNRRHTNQKTNDHTSNDIDLLDEWWEDNNTDLIGTNPSMINSDTKITKIPTVDDSGNSSLSTSMNLKETSLEDFVNPPSDVSTTDSHIIESLDKLQQELKLEEAFEERLASTESNKDMTTYDTAHFMQWAKEKFREELAGRLTAQEIEQHDAVATDDDDNEPKLTNNIEKIDDRLEDDLHEKLIIDENLPKTIVVE